MTAVRPSDEREGALASLWERTTPRDRAAASPLSGPVHADICVVGAGMAGLSVAYELGLRGQRVVVLDDGPIGGGETSRTTAHVTTAFDDYYHEVERLHGTEAMRRLADAFRGGVRRIATIATSEGIDCDLRWVDGWWFAPDEAGAEQLDAEADAALRAGFLDVSLEPAWPVPHLTAQRVLRWPNQLQFHPLRYVDGLARALIARGGQIFTSAHVTAVQDATDDRPARVETDAGITVTANAVVVATNSPVNDWVAMHTKQAPYRTYAMALQIARGAVPAGLYWDTLEPYHYVRLYGGSTEAQSDADDLLIVGGEDHKTGQEADERVHFERLETWVRARFAVGDVVAQWSGQVLEPVDALAFIGRNPGDRHVYIATGDSGNGITHGAIAGLLLADLVEGIDNPWAPLFDPGRVSLKALPTWVRENANVARQYADLLTPGEVPSLDAVGAGQGRIVRDGVQKLAAYRDEAGQLTVRSAICTHLGCVVDWNAAEKTWDCPCHGSRFAVDGRVINGPAVAPLRAASPREDARRELPPPSLAALPITPPAQSAPESAAASAAVPATPRPTEA
jgi:glycine/D-amino acid oxidase-like deaminating enzyme/nitrite reductase/ring-hydroxylating ferredoxin subunit